MSHDITCQKCKSENVIFSKKRQVNFCEDCGYEFELENIVESMRIFLSYGHDSNEELVRLIKADLESRGHDVWFDKSQIKSGADWRKSITDGILKSNRVLSFLSKHSTRHPGVCLDEIAIAIGAKGGNIQTILVESEVEVQPPPSISHIQWLDMHDWKDRQALDEPAWKAWYQSKFAEIVEILESDEGRRFAGEIEELSKCLKPISADARLSYLLNKPFVGREWLIDAIEDWRLDPEQDSRVFWIVGNPGVGKSSFAANLSHFGRDKVIAAHFCEWDKDDHRNAQRVVRSIAFQIAARLPDYRKLLLTLPEIHGLDDKNPAELFDYLLSNPLQNVINGDRERYLIVIDALDEASEGGFNPLAEMLSRNAQRLPDWIGIVVTSRPEKPVSVNLQNLNPFFFDAENENNLADIQGYVHTELVNFLKNQPESNQTIQKIIEKSEGVFLYVEHICNELKLGNLSIDQIDDFPHGLGQIFLQFFTRRFAISKEQSDSKEFDLHYFQKRCRPLLELVTVAQEPLNPSFISLNLKIDAYQLNDIIDAFGSFVRSTDDQIRLIHKSLIDWLCDRSKSGSYWVERIEGHKRLAAEGIKQFKDGVSGKDSYFNQHLPMHLAGAGDWDNLISLTQSRELDLIERWTSRGESHVGIICLQGMVSHLLSQKKEISLAAGLMTQIARIHSSQGNYSEAEEQIEKAIKLSKDPRISSIAFHELGSLYHIRGSLVHAEKYFSKAMGLCQKNRDSLADELAGNLISLASIRLLQYNYPAVFDLANEALETAKDAGDLPRTIAANRILSTAYKDNLQYEEAETHLQTAEMLAKFDHLHMEGISNSHLHAWLLYTKSLLNGEPAMGSAVDMFKRTIENADKYAYTPYAISAKLGLLRCALVEYQIQVAQDIFTDVERAITSESAYDLVIGARLAKAGIMHQQGKIEQSKKEYDKALKLCRRFNQKARETDALQGIGAILFHGGNKEEAVYCWDKAQTIAQACSPARYGLILKSVARSKANQKATPL